MNAANQQTDLERLFVTSLGVLNRALDANRGLPPYQQILADCSKRLEGQLLGVDVYTDDPDRPVARFTVCFQNGLFEPKPGDPPDEQHVWKVSAEKLRDIVAEESRYASDPRRLPWGWLGSPLEVESS